MRGGWNKGRGEENMKKILAEGCFGKGKATNKTMKDLSHYTVCLFRRKYYGI